MFLANRRVPVQVREIYSEAGIALPALAVNALCRVGMAKWENRNSVAKILEQAVEVAVELGIDLLQLPSFVKGMIETEEEFANTVECLKIACDCAAKAGAQIGTENALDGENNLKLFSEVDRSNLRSFFDTQNPWAFSQVSSASVLDATKHLLCDVVHVKDGMENRLSSELLGEGDSDFFATFDRLKKIGFDGWFVLENNYRRLGEKWKSGLEYDLSVLNR